MYKVSSQNINLVFYLLFTENLFEAKSEVGVVYMDFKKTFDSVSHNEPS